MEILDIILILILLGVNTYFCYKVCKLQEEVSKERRKNLVRKSETGINNQRLNGEIIRQETLTSSISFDK